MPANQIEQPRIQVRGDVLQPGGALYDAARKVSKIVLRARPRRRSGVRRTIAAAAIVSGGALLAAAVTVSANWQFAHGDRANTGFIVVDTTAGWPSAGPHLGSIAPGANPVVSPDGTVYIGNFEGELRAFHADGTPKWTRQLASAHGGILAAPVVGADGAVYVVSTIRTTERHDSFLHKFSASGAWLYWRPFPEHRFATPTAHSGSTNAPPNIWRWNGTEAIIVPAIYPAIGGKDLRLLAFSTGGTVLADESIKRTTYPVTGGWDPESNWIIACVATGPLFPLCSTVAFINYGAHEFLRDGSPVPLYGAGFPLPGAAIRPEPNGGAPLIIVTDGAHDRVAYTFSPESGFAEVWRSTHWRRFTTPPVVLPNGMTLTGTLDGHLLRTDANLAQVSAISDLGTLTAPPTRLADGGLVVVSREGVMNVIRNYGSQIQLAGESIASAAASCNHVFVSSTNAFEVFDARTLQRVVTMPWTRGGLSAPVIGPAGYVYAVAGDTLYVLPPWNPRWGGEGIPSCAVLAPPS